MPKVKPLARSSSPIGTIQYIERGIKNKSEQGTYNVIRNITNHEAMSREFIMLENSGSRKYYHEIIAFDPRDNERCSPSMMRDFVNNYIKEFYSDHKVYWGVHRDKSHPHIHLTIGATGLSSNRKIHFSGDRLRRQDKFIQEMSKKLGLSFFEGHELFQTKEKLTQEEIEMKKERNKPSDKEHIKEVIVDAVNANSVDSKYAFVEYLKAHNIELNKRETGVQYNNRNFRFKTLGFSSQFLEKKKYLNIDQEILEKKESKIHNEIFKEANYTESDLIDITKQDSRSIFKILQSLETQVKSDDLSKQEEGIVSTMQIYSQLKAEDKPINKFHYYYFLQASKDKPEQCNAIFSEMKERHIDISSHHYSKLIQANHADSKKCLSLFEELDKRDINEKKPVYLSWFRYVNASEEALKLVNYMKDNDSESYEKYGKKLFEINILSTYKRAKYSGKLLGFETFLEKLKKEDSEMYKKIGKSLHKIVVLTQLKEAFKTDPNSKEINRLRKKLADIDPIIEKKIQKRSGIETNKKEPSVKSADTTSSEFQSFLNNNIQSIFNSVRGGVYEDIEKDMFLKAKKPGLRKRLVLPGDEGEKC